MNLKNRYKIHRTIRYILAIPFVFLLAYFVAGILHGLCLFVEKFYIYGTIASYILFLLISFFLLKYLFRRYKSFQYGKLFVTNPKLSLFLLTIENISLGIFHFGFVLIHIMGYFQRFDESEIGAYATIFGIAVAPVCICIFVISYWFNEKKQSTSGG